MLVDYFLQILAVQRLGQLVFHSCSRASIFDDVAFV